MATGAGGARVRRLFRRAANAGSLGGVIFQGIGAILLAVGTAVASGVLALADVVIIPLQVVGQVLGGLIEAVFGGAAFIIGMAARTTGLSLSPGAMFDLGPFTFALGIGAVLLGFYVIVAYRSEEPTSNFFPGVPFDIPTPGLLDNEEDDKD